MELISRDEAIKQIQKVEQEPNYQHDYEGWRDGLIIAENIVDELPTIEERKEGEWVYESCSRLIDETDEGRVYAIEKRWHCSRCGFSKGFMMYRPDEKYCPNCGAKMKRRADDNTV